MSLFDTIICDYPLPLPDFTKEEIEDMNGGASGKIDWKASEWQTKDLDSLLDIYSLEDDGQIYVRKTNWLENPDSPTGVTPEEGELEKYERTGEINFYNIILGKEYDHWLEFKATFWKGEIKELDLSQYSKEDNTERKKYVDQMSESMEILKAAKGRRWYNPYSIYRFLLTKPLGLIRTVLSFVVGLTLRLERWMP